VAFAMWHVVVVICELSFVICYLLVVICDLLFGMY